MACIVLSPTLFNVWMVKNGTVLVCNVPPHARRVAGVGWKIKTDGGPGGIYTLSGKIVSFWYR